RPAPRGRRAARRGGRAGARAGDAPRAPGPAGVRAAPRRHQRGGEGGAPLPRPGGSLGLLERDALAHVEARVADLDRLLAGGPCYWLTVREGVPAEATALLRELVGRAKEAAS